MHDFFFYPPAKQAVINATILACISALETAKI